MFFREQTEVCFNVILRVKALELSKFLKAFLVFSALLSQMSLRIAFSCHTKGGHDLFVRLIGFHVRSGVEKVSDHETIGPRKKFYSQKIFPRMTKVVIISVKGP